MPGRANYVELQPHLNFICKLLSNSTKKSIYNQKMNIEIACKALKLGLQFAVNGPSAELVSLCISQPPGTMFNSCSRKSIVY